MGSWIKSLGAAVAAAALGAAMHYTGVTDPGAYVSGLGSAVLSAVIGAVISSLVHIHVPGPTDQPK